jgi:hypothetical protein
MLPPAGLLSGHATGVHSVRVLGRVTGRPLKWMQCVGRQLAYAHGVLAVVTSQSGLERVSGLQPSIGIVAARLRSPRSRSAPAPPRGAEHAWAGQAMPRPSGTHLPHARAVHVPSMLRNLARATWCRCKAHTVGFACRACVVAPQASAFWCLADPDHNRSRPSAAPSGSSGGGLPARGEGLRPQRGRGLGHGQLWGARRGDGEQLRGAGPSVAMHGCFSPCTGAPRFYRTGTHAGSLSRCHLTSWGGPPAGRQASRPASSRSLLSQFDEEAGWEPPVSLVSCWPALRLSSAGDRGSLLRWIKRGCFRMPRSVSRSHVWVPAGGREEPAGRGNQGLVVCTRRFVGNVLQANRSSLDLSGRAVVALPHAGLLAVPPTGCPKTS